jgi:hypothetical protein
VTFNNARIFSGKLQSRSHALAPRSRCIAPVWRRAALGEQLRAPKTHILKFNRLITAWQRPNETSKRLDALTGGGPALAHDQHDLDITSDSLGRNRTMNVRNVGVRR